MVLGYGTLGRIQWHEQNHAGTGGRINSDVLSAQSGSLCLQASHHIGRTAVASVPATRHRQAETQQSTGPLTTHAPIAPTVATALSASRRASRRSNGICDRGNRASCSLPGSPDTIPPLLPKQHTDSSNWLLLTTLHLPYAVYNNRPKNPAGSSR